MELSFSSNYFLVCNRVKHGTVLSQVLFSVYIDDLMLQLAKERKGKESGKRSDVDHKVLPANTPHLPFLHISIR